MEKWPELSLCLFASIVLAFLASTICFIHSSLSCLSSVTQQGVSLKHPKDADRLAVGGDSGFKLYASVSMLF